MGNKNHRNFKSENYQTKTINYMTTNFRLNRKILVAALFVQLFCLSSQAQKVNDSTTPLHLMQPAYDTPYGKPEVKSIIEVLDRIYNYLDQTTPMVLINKETPVSYTHLTLPTKRIV